METWVPFRSSESRLPDFPEAAFRLNARAKMDSAGTLLVADQVGYLPGDDGGLPGAGAGQDQGGVLIGGDVPGLLVGQFVPQQVLVGIADRRYGVLKECLVLGCSGPFQGRRFGG